MSKELTHDLGKFLRSLHDFSMQNGMHEFEDIGNSLSFHEYISKVTKKYLFKLRQAVKNREHLSIAETAVVQISRLLQEVTEPELVILHKDIHFGNLLMSDGGHLSGVVDWETSQSGPREWEFAILRQRFPEVWQDIVRVYDHNLDYKIMNLVGLVQSLRFWKSFPEDLVFAQSQIDYILKILDEM